MLIKNILRKMDKTGVRGRFATAFLPLGFAADVPETTFLRPLDRALTATGLGRATGQMSQALTETRPAGLAISMKLVTDAPRALHEVAAILTRLDAPKGSTVGNAEKPDLVKFGAAEGLVLSIAEADITLGDDDRLDVLEACTDALEGAGLYVGRTWDGDRTALYFYGDSFNRMRNAITFVMTTDARCRNAVARRMT
ncbi:MAG: hypothetical protein AAFR35_14515 [Pseudomonadota bacterium]